VLIARNEQQPLFSPPTSATPNRLSEHGRARSHAMTDPTTLPFQDLARIVTNIQEYLWLDLTDKDEPFWNPEKEWDLDTIEIIAGVLMDFGLHPVEPSAVTPTT
jgi:hypothetical protein